MANGLTRWARPSGNWTAKCCKEEKKEGMAERLTLADLCLKDPALVTIALSSVSHWFLPIPELALLPLPIP